MVNHAAFARRNIDVTALPSSLVSRDQRHMQPLLDFGKEPTGLRAAAVLRESLNVKAEPREFTVVNIVGPVDLEKLAGLEGQFGIPHIYRDGKGKHGKDEHND